jgi:hypothetical protein
MSSATKAPGAEGTGAYGIPGLPDRLSQSDQLRIFSAYYADRLPAEAAAELCELADEWDEQIASAPAPSDPAGAGGDLGELERLSKAAPFPIELRRGCLEVKTEPHRTNNGYLGKEMAEYVFALVNAHRSGQLVASTSGQKGAGEAIKFAVGIDDHYDRLEFLQSCLSGDTSEWPEFIQTPPPSATPEGDPPMTVEEESPCHWGGGNDIIWCSTCGAEYAYAKGETRPACPRTLHAAGEVRHG